MNMRRMQPATMMLALLSSSMVLVVTAELKNLTVYRVTPKNVTQSGEFMRNAGEVVQIYTSEVACFPLLSSCATFQPHDCHADYFPV